MWEADLSGRFTCVGHGPVWEAHLSVTAAVCKADSAGGARTDSKSNVT